MFQFLPATILFSYFKMAGLPFKVYKWQKKTTYKPF